MATFTSYQLILPTPCNQGKNKKSDITEQEVVFFLTLLFMHYCCRILPVALHLRTELIFFLWKKKQSFGVLQLVGNNQFKTNDLKNPLVYIYS